MRHWLLLIALPLLLMACGEEKKEACYTGCDWRDACVGFAIRVCPGYVPSEMNDICLDGIHYHCQTPPESTCCAGSSESFLKVGTCGENTPGCDSDGDRDTAYTEAEREAEKDTDSAESEEACYTGCDGRDACVGFASRVCPGYVPAEMNDICLDGIHYHCQTPPDSICCPGYSESFLKVGTCGENTPGCDSDGDRDTAERDAADSEAEREAEAPKAGSACTPPGWVCASDSVGLSCDSTSKTWVETPCPGEYDGCQSSFGLCTPAGCTPRYFKTGASCGIGDLGYCTTDHNCVGGSDLLGTACDSPGTRYCVFLNGSTPDAPQTAVYLCGAEGKMIVAPESYGVMSRDCGNEKMTCRNGYETALTLCPCGEGADCEAPDGDFD